MLFEDVVLGDEDEVADGIVDEFGGGGSTGPLHLLLHCELFKHLGTKERHQWNLVRPILDVGFFAHYNPSKHSEQQKNKSV